MTGVRIDGGVTAPHGFMAAGVSCGIKARGLDLALVVSDRPAAAAGLFTTNLAVAAPVVVSREHLDASGGHARAIVVNSGCANACTGPGGLEAARLMAAETARAVGCDIEEVLVASTGVIGVALDRHKVTSGVIDAYGSLGRDGHAAAALAIMTTDPWPKEAAVEAHLAGGAVRIGGMAKGSGMIEPNMATMLAFLTTDAAVTPGLLGRALAAAVEDTFNAITVDGECSTNDSVFLLANGASGVTVSDDEFDVFVDALREVCLALALGIVRGGEGATKLVTVVVTGAASYADARRAARAIANSLLVKTAVHGGDPNWGRLVAVAGRAGVAFTLSRAKVRIGGVVLFEDGRPFDERAERAAAELAATDVELGVDLGTGGRHEATMWTCDLSADYVRINAEYPDVNAMPMKKDFLSILDLDAETLAACLDLSAELKRDRGLGRRARSADALGGRHVALLFEKPSLRTRSTFEIAVRELGGEVISPAQDATLGGRESIADVARNLERWVAAVVIRTFEQAKLVAFAAAAPRLHVVNALTNEEHPCQALADCLTLREHWSMLPGRTLAFVGDGNNVAASLAQACLMLGINVHVASPAGYDLPADVVAAATAVARGGATVTAFRDPHEAVREADAVYTDVWTSMGQEAENATRRVAFAPYQVNADLMASARPGAIFMHCLPAHRGDEVTDEVIDSPASVVLDQAENRLHTQKALLQMLVAPESI